MSRKGPASLVAARSHEQRVLRRFDELRREEQLCDVTLVVEDVRFKAHKALLAASSDFFSVMFTAGEQLHPSTLRLDGMTADAFAAALDFIYGAQVRVEERAAAPLLSAARRVELGELVRALTEPSRDGGGATKLLRRKRGRPRREEGEAPPTDDAAAQRRHSERKVRPPAKFRGYKVSSDRARGEEEEEAGRRGGRKRHPPSEARCGDCGKFFKHHLFLQVHRRTHTGEKPFHCSACGKSFTQKHTLQAHQRVHSGERPFVCAVCSKSLSTKHSLQEHMSLHQEKTFTCDKCEKSFTQKRQLKNHYRTHTGKSLPECAECQRRFMDTAQLKKHLRTHTGEKPFTCEICGKCFTAKSTLQTHIRIHRGEKPFDCGVCGKTFSDPSARRRHAATHSEKKAFTCSVCSLSFTRLDNLKTHAKTHSREGGVQEEPRGALLLQPPLGSEPEIQLLVTDQNLSFAAGQQEISLLAADGGAAHPAHSRFTLLAQTDAVSPPIHAVSMLDGATHPHPEQMHIITLSKEAVEQLQAHHETPPSHGTAPGQVSRPPSRAIHVSSQSGQPICISQTSQQLCSQHIQGQSFQIQAGTVSYLYASGLPQDTPPPESTPLQKLPGS
uniref:Zinc finger and BTB domain containing 24 n=1 Tax=Oryzias latipes TaxID=8090 RepID=A0A3P9H1G6_ORYLA